MVDPDAIEAAFRRDGDTVTRIETHISWVFLGRDRVLKVKKPVRFGFLDFSTARARREACEEELRVNARFAPGVYLRLVPIVRAADGRIVFGGPGEIVEYGVSMTRLPDAERADVLVESGRFGGRDVDRIASRIAMMHAESERGAELDAFAIPEAISANVRENFVSMRGRLDELLTPAEAEGIEAWQTKFLEEQRSRFFARIASGAIRDGHGDLRLEHCYLGGGPEGVRILDAIEFSRALRAGDVASDVAFLSMDLASAGHVELAERFLATYARAANDFDLYGVVDFYESYRACVRGKIAVLRASDPGATDDEARAARATARRMFLLALACGKRAMLRPTVVAVGGLIASGKSTLADALGAAMSAPVIEADRTRKHLVHVEATTPLHHGAWDGAYSLAFTERVYAEVLRRARVVLESGRPVVLDASFRSREMRARARALAEACGVPFRFVECSVPVAICKARLAEREKTASVSDGRREIFDDFAKSFEPVTELAAEEHVVVDGTKDTKDILAGLGSRLPIWPAGLTR